MHLISNIIDGLTVMMSTLTGGSTYAHMNNEGSLKTCTLDDPEGHCKLQEYIINCWNPTDEQHNPIPAGVKSAVELVCVKIYQSFVRSIATGGR